MRLSISLILLTVLAVSCSPATTPEASQSKVTVPGSHSAALTLPGVDVLMARNLDLLRGQRVGLLTNRTGCLVDGRRTIDVLWHAPEVELVRLFSPEHGLETLLEGRVGDAADGLTDLPVRSLYGQQRRPRPEDLADLDLLVFDVQDVGVRFYTYTTTLFYLLGACSEMEQESSGSAPSVLVLDRPNPLACYGPRGPLSDPGRRSFICPADLPLMHGLTVGELARWRVAQEELAVELRVVPMENWDPNSQWSDTGLPWRAPSPNLRTPTSALLYPMLGMLEATNLSVGRGTHEPFMRVGAPWLDGRALCLRLRDRTLPGLATVPLEFIPSSGPFEGELCSGVQFEVLDRAALRQVQSGIVLMQELIELGGDEFDWHRTDERLAHAVTLQAVWDLRERRTVPEEGAWHSQLDQWRESLKPYLLYPRNW